MFKICVQSGGPEERIGIDATYRMIKETGFDAVDANVDHLLSGGQIERRERPAIFTGTDREAAAAFAPWADAAKKYGLENYQAHAPFPSLVADDEEYNDFLVEMLRKTIVGCDAMDCRHLIIHPFFLSYSRQLTPQEEWEINIDRYSRLIPAAKEYGVTLCLENMFTGYRGKIYSAICSDFDTTCRYIDTLNEIAGAKCFAFCLDTGHALLVGKDIKNEMIRLGDRIKAFHVHDNNGINDQHLAPYMGVLDWNRFIEGLAAIGFDRTLSFETFNIWNVVDPELCPTFMRMISETGRMFDRRAAEMRK